MHRLLLVCVSTFLPLLAQNQQKFKITGSVVNSATGEPIGHALIEVAGAHSVLSGVDGRFELDDVPAGTVYVNARRPGFDRDTDPAQTTVDSSTEPLVIKLVPEAKLSGTVVDEEGEPVEGVSVQCLHQMILNGRKEWQPAQGANTDEGGHFQLENLIPGAYLLHTQEKPLYMVAKQTSEPARYVYPATFYPDAPSREMAQTINLAPGQDMKVDLAVHSLRAAHVSFVTVPPYPNISGVLESSDGSVVGGGHVDASGVFTFGAVPPGSWKIVVRQTRQDGMYGELPVDVGNADLENLKVPMAPLPDIPVLVSGVTTQPVFVQLMAKSGQIHGSNVSQDGQMKIHAVNPGTYRVLVQQSGNNQCVTSVTSGSLDLMREDLVVSAGASVPPIQVVESNTCGSITVTANTNSPAYMVVTSNLEGFNPQLEGVSSQGTVIPDLPPAEYKVYAFDNLQDLEYANPDVMRSYKSQTVELETGQKASVQLEVNQRAAK